MAGRRPRASAATLASSQTALHEALLAQLPGLVWATDADLRCQLVSPAAAARLGLAVGSTIAGTPASRRADGFAEGHRQALAGETARTALRRGDASFSCRLEPLRDADGSVIGVIGSAVDTTERDRAARVVETQLAVFAATLENVPEGIAVCDATGHFLYANAAARHFAEREAMGTSLADANDVWGQWYDDHGAVPPEQWPMARALREEVVAPVEMYKIMPDGEREHRYMAAAPLRDGSGALIGAAVTAVDITARKRAEQQVQELNQQLERRVAERTAELERAIHARERDAAERRHAMDLLARSEQLLRDIVDHSTAVIFLKDLDGRYLLINRHYERLFGVTGAEWVGRTDYELFPVAVAETLRANDRQVLAAGTPLHLEEVVPTGGRDRTYISVKFPLRGRDGEVYGVCGMATDITEQKQMERALRRSEAMLASVIESSSQPICALDRDRQIVAINRAALVLIPELIGGVPDLGTLRGQFPEEFAEPWRELITQSMRGARFTVERTLTVAGVTRQFLVSFNPIVQDGAVTGVALFGREITELRQAEEAMRQHQAELAHVLRLHTMGEMAAGLAHEVNQPLGAIANYAQGCRNRLRAGTIDESELLETVEAITREALRAGEITRRVRELLRKEEAQRVPTDAAAIVRAALGIVAATANRMLVAVTARIDPGLLPVLIDPIQVEQVIVNLVLNAIEAVANRPDPRTVEVRATLAGPAAAAVEIAVSDSGPGIDPALEHRIFEPFLTTKPAGLGMGLAISRSIVAAHGGRLWHTPNPGGGTTFHFTLPAASES